MQPLDALPEPTPEFGSPISRGFRLYGDNWRLLLPFILMTLVGNAIVLLMSPTQSDPSAMYDMQMLALMCLMPIVSLAVYVFLLLPAILGMTVVWGYRGLGQPLTASEALRRGLSRGLVYIGTLILESALFFVLIVPVVLVIFIVAFSMGLMVEGHAAPEVTTGLMGLALGCGLGLVIAGIFLYVVARLLFAPIAVVLGRLGPVDSLKHSWNLSEHNILRVLGIMLVVYIPVIIISAVPLLAASFLPAGWLALSVRLVFIVASTLYAPVVLAVMTVLWYQLRAEREPDPAAFVSELP